MNTFIPFPGQITVDWLTSVLRQSGALPAGRVIQVQVRSTDAFNSHTSHLTVQYSADAPATLSSALVLKLNTNAEWAKAAGKEEVTFYRLIGTQPNRPPIYIPCLAAEYDENSGNSYLLLQDVSETHQPPINREDTIANGVPSVAHIASVVDALAQHHAYWWEHALLGSGPFPVGYWSRTLERFGLYLTRRKTSWANLLAQAGDWLPSDVRTLYEQVLTSLPCYWQRHLAGRFQSGSTLTLVHGDAYFSNFLCPKQSGSPSASSYMLDWQSPVFDIGSHDLANLCATFWMPEQRHAAQREVGILRQYLAGLQAHGVTHYSWEDLTRDYQHGLIYWLLVPVQDGSDGSPAAYWWPKMQCLVHAFSDWQCQTLLD